MDPPALREVAHLLARSTRADIGSLRATRLGPLERDGFVVVPGHIPAAVCTALADQVVTLVDALPRSIPSSAHSTDVDLPSGARVRFRRSSDGRVAYDDGLVDIGDADLEIRDLRPLADDPRPLQLIHAACGIRVRRQNTNVYLNRDVVHPRAFHCDSLTGGRVQFKAFYLLTDVDVDDGPYAYVRGSHRADPRRQLNLVANWVLRRPVTDMRWHARRRVVRFTGDRGTLVLSNQSGFHRGWPQLPGRTRVMAVNNYVSDAPRARD